MAAPNPPAALSNDEIADQAVEYFINTPAVKKSRVVAEVTPNNLFDAFVPEQLPAADPMHVVTNDCRQALLQEMNGSVHWRDDFTRADAVHRIFICWSSAQGVTMNPFWPSHPSYPGGRSCRLMYRYHESLRGLAPFLCVIFMLGPNFSINKLVGKKNRINDIKSIAEHEKQAIIIPALQNICKLGDSSGTLGTWDKLLQRDIKSYYIHQFGTILDNGVWSWEYVGQFIDADLDDYDADANIEEMLKGINFEVAKVLRYVHKDFALPNSEDKYWITDVQKAELDGCILYNPEDGALMEAIH